MLIGKLGNTLADGSCRPRFRPFKLPPVIRKSVGPSKLVMDAGKQFFGVFLTQLRVVSHFILIALSRLVVVALKSKVR